MTAMILLLAICSSAARLEAAGDLASAGAAWEAEGSMQGQVRVVGRMIEEAIYAGHGRRALLLMEELMATYPDHELYRFWEARIAWSCGLCREAVSSLESLETHDPWLKSRASGLAALYSGDAPSAAESLELSLREARTARRAFWSAVDLCSAYLAMGRFSDALLLSELLVHHFPGDRLAQVMYGLCLHGVARHGDAFEALSSVSPDNPAAYQMSRALMEGFLR
jgi:hypothetical protein